MFICYGLLMHLCVYVLFVYAFEHVHVAQYVRVYVYMNLVKIHNKKNIKIHMFFLLNGCIYVYICNLCMHSCTCMLRDIYVCMVTKKFTFYVLLVYLCIHVLFMYAFVRVYVA